MLPRFPKTQRPKMSAVCAACIRKLSQAGLTRSTECDVMSCCERTMVGLIESKSLEGDKQLSSGKLCGEKVAEAVQHEIHIKTYTSHAWPWKAIDLCEFAIRPSCGLCLSVAPRVRLPHKRPSTSQPAGQYHRVGPSSAGRQAVFRCAERPVPIFVPSLLLPPWVPIWLLLSAVAPVTSCESCRYSSSVML